MKSQNELLFQKRRIRLRLRYHSILALISVVLITIFWQTLPSPDPIFRLSMATAYTGLGLLSTTLLTGPWNVLYSRPNPLSTDLRRDIGIWSAIISIAHVLIGLQVHMRGKPWLYFLYPANESHLLPIRIDPFGLANYTGLLATLIVILLLAISNDISLRILGARRWKALQRWNYGLFAFVAFHAIAYQLIEKRQLPYPLIFIFLIAVVVIIQGVGFSRRKQEVLTEQR